MTGIEYEAAHERPPALWVIRKQHRTSEQYGEIFDIHYRSSVITFLCSDADNIHCYYLILSVSSGATRYLLYSKY